MKNFHSLLCQRKEMAFHAKHSKQPSAIQNENSRSPRFRQKFLKCFVGDLCGDLCPPSFREDPPDDDEVSLIEQVTDDSGLLTVMMEDHKKASPLFQATAFWQRYEKLFLPELYKKGLHDFRRRKNSILASFGATDILKPETIGLKIPLLNKWLSLKFYDDFSHLCSEFARLYGRQTGARALEQLTPSLTGNPQYVVDMAGKKYPISILNYYLRYAYLCQFINFDTISVVTELGSGSGKQIEVLKKLHPKLSFLIFDIPPQLYVCEQYLKAVFPNDVISYRDTKGLSDISSPDSGKIYIFGSYKFPILESVKTDLFWNAASLQEIEPEMAKHYLSFVNRSSKAVYLHEWMSGVREKGKLIIETQLKHYEEALTNFKKIDLSPAYILPKVRRSENYKDSFWTREDSSCFP